MFNKNKTTEAINEYQIPGYLFPIFAMIAGVSFSLDLQVEPRHTPISLITAFVGATCARFLKPLLGEQSGSLISGIAVVLCSNFFANLIPPHVEMVGMVPGILMLVPGALGIRFVLFFCFFGLFFSNFYFFFIFLFF